MKNNYLTPMEQMIYSFIFDLDIVCTDDIKKAFPELTSQHINKVFSSMSKKGYLRRLKRGVYLVQDGISHDPIITDPNRIALAIFSGYIGFSSALKVYGLLDYEPFTVFVVNRNKSGQRTLGEYTFRAVALGRNAVGFTYRNGIHVSTLAKTFFDCFYRPQYAGGYSTVAKALYSAQLHWDEFVGYFSLTSNALCQRTGYVLNMIAEATGKDIPVLSYFRERVKNNTRLIPTGPPNGRYNREWMVLDNLGMENILSWWYNG